MDPQLVDKLTQLETKIDAIYVSVEKTRKYFLWTLTITGVMVALPLIGLVFALPAFFSYYGDINSQIQVLNGL